METAMSNEDVAALSPRPGYADILIFIKINRSGMD
jgi:hypothetical protein